MIPRTKIQHYVWSLRNKLLPVTEKQKEYAFAKCLDHIGHRTKKGITCMDCGKFFTDSSQHKTATCPHCYTKIKVVTTRKKKFSQTEYMALLDVVEGIQVSRTLEIKSWHRAGEKAHVWVTEVFQHYFGIDNNTYLVARLRTSFMNDHFSGDLEIRDHKNSDQYCYTVNKVYPEYKVLPIFKKLGFKGNLHSVSPYRFFTRIENNNKAETLLKSSQPYLFFHEITASRSCWRYWDSIKICIRNKYKVKDVPTYYDYLDLLHRFRKDLRSPKYVCPIDLKKEHDRLVKKKTELDFKRKLTEQREKITREDEAYKELRKDYFGLSFSNGKITIKVLESVKQFMEHGDLLKHCVFASEYYKKSGSLVLGAYVGDEPIETVEVSLKSMDIVQSRGLHNNGSMYNDDIKQLVTANIGKIRSIYNSLQQA